MEAAKSSVEAVGNVKNKVSGAINEKINMISNVLGRLNGQKGVYVATILVMILFLFSMFYKTLKGYFKRTYNFYDRMYGWANPEF